MIKYYTSKLKMNFLTCDKKDPLENLTNPFATYKNNKKKEKMYKIL